jgi:hypothetical protein
MLRLKRRQLWQKKSAWTFELSIALAGTRPGTRERDIVRGSDGQEHGGREEQTCMQLALLSQIIFLLYYFNLLNYLYLAALDADIASQINNS